MNIVKTQTLQDVFTRMISDPTSFVVLLAVCCLCVVCVVTLIFAIRHARAEGAREGIIAGFKVGLKSKLAPATSLKVVPAVASSPPPVIPVKESLTKEQEASKTKAKKKTEKRKNPPVKKPSTAQKRTAKKKDCKTDAPKDPQ